MRTHLCRTCGLMALQSVRSYHTATWPVLEAAHPPLVGTGVLSPPDRFRHWSPPPVTHPFPLMASIAPPPAQLWYPSPLPHLCHPSMPSAAFSCPRTSRPTASKGPTCPRKPLQGKPTTYLRAARWRAQVKRGNSEAGLHSPPQQLMPCPPQPHTLVDVYS